MTDRGHEYHKGEPCPYRPIRCAEGYCMRCQVYEEHLGEHRLFPTRLLDGLGDSGLSGVDTVASGGLN